MKTNTNQIRLPRCILTLLTVLLLTIGGATAGTVVPETFQALGYAGSRDRNYSVYVPDSYTEQNPVPMIMVLHGCNQTEQNMIQETHFRALADREDFIVVYPFITSYEGERIKNCWGFWLDEERHEGAGEVQDLYQIALEVESKYAIDPHRRYVTGLSSGGAMSVALAVTQNEYFAAAGSAEGIPYSETDAAVGLYCWNTGVFRSVAEICAAMRAEQSAANEQRTIPFLAVHSINDCTVNKKASENIRDAWVSCYDADSTPFVTTDCEHEGVPCTHRKYGTPERSVVETVFYEGVTGTGTHYWVGDNDGTYANSQGPSASELFWGFFKRHPFSLAPTVTIASTAVDNSQITVTGTAADSNGEVVQVNVRLEGAHPQDPKQATGTESWSTTFADLPDGDYIAVAAATDNDGAVGEAVGSRVWVGEPPENIPPTVELDRASVEGTCLTVTGEASDPDGSVTKVEVELDERGFKSATFPTNIGGTGYRYQECELPSGSYAIAVRATDDMEAQTVIIGPTQEIPDLDAATGTWLEHMNAGRLRLYSAPCPSVGFGFCDLSFSEVFLKFGSSPFTVYQARGTNEWYVEPSNIPTTAVAAVAAVSITSAQLQVHDVDCIVVSGQPSSGVSLARVELRIDSEPFEEAQLSTDGWAYNKCGLSPGPHALAIVAQNAAMPSSEDQKVIKFVFD